MISSAGHLISTFPVLRFHRTRIFTPDLPVEVVENTLPKDKQICPECGEALHVMGRDIRRELKLIPAKAVIVEHVRYTYVCRDCEKMLVGFLFLKHLLTSLSLRVVLHILKL
ncbi:IS66 family transposase zinc-finger binding domain-containing protein [Ruminiclostridium sufflavum]|uniref:IS66 family transposase zinc-finger binding domain-containing protein n=1 Tax=Ruminiclostridium sufflavum TaxID=396504 RepID=UPI000D7C13E3